MAITHSTAADANFTPRGKIAWEAEHSGYPSYTSAAATDQKTFFTWQPASSGRGPFVMDGYEPSFSSTRDPSMAWGYNAGATGAAILAGENAIQWNIESNYNDGSGANKMEVYIQYLHTDGTTTARPFFLSMNRTTGLVHLLQLKANTVTFRDESAVGEGGTITHLFEKNVYTIKAVDTSTNSQLVINAAASRSAIIDLGYNGNASVMRLITASATTGQIEYGGRTVVRLYSTPLGSAGESIAVGVDDNGACGTFDSRNCGNGVATLVARAKSSQTATTFQVQDSTSTAVFSVNRTGLTAVGGATLVSTTALLTPAGTTGISSIRIPHGSAPTSPVDGDMWSTSSGLFIRINGGTVGPLS